MCQEWSEIVNWQEQLVYRDGENSGDFARLKLKNFTVISGSLADGNPPVFAFNLIKL
ncbi:hypothetical protein NSP_5920 [Nodularia spumigena CCY9414]|jgi:hypothetical protein|nr:hypothetical protein NSP_5920 [Nodularia spumigena CCY9414]